MGKEAVINYYKEQIADYTSAMNRAYFFGDGAAVAILKSEIAKCKQAIESLTSESVNA